MEPHLKTLETAENNRHLASALEEIDYQINRILQRIGAFNTELAALYSANCQDFQAAYNAVQSSLLVIDQVGITELRSFPIPAEPVEKVARGVLILFGSNDLSWSAFINLSREHFLESLANFDILDNPRKRVTELQPIIDEFQGSGVDLRRFSITAHKLFNWILGVYQLCQVISQFNPTNQLRAEINEKRQGVASLHQRLAELRNESDLLREQIDNTSSS